MRKYILIILAVLLLSGCSTNKTKAIYIGTDLESKYDQLDELFPYINQDAKLNGYTIKYGLLVGDNVEGVEAYKLKDVSSYLTKGLNGLNKKDIYYAFGSHDESADISDTNGFVRGGIDLGDFYLYGIDFYEMTDYSDGEDGIRIFNDWLDTINNDKPIIILSHVPLHKRRGDNHAATLWMNRINEVAEDFDILFFWGHNHTNETNLDDELDFKRPGSMIQTEGDDFETEINFYYINAGYIRRGVSVILILNSDVNWTYRPLYLEKCGFDEGIVETIELKH